MLQEWLSMSAMYECVAGTDGLYNRRLIGGADNLAASAILDPLLDSGNGIGAVCSWRTFT